MADVNAGNIKAKASVEYDPSGLKAFKDDLKGLPEMISGLEEGAGNAGDGLAALDEQMSKGAESTRALTSAMGGLEKPVSAGEDAVSGMTEALSEQQGAIEDTTKSLDTMQGPLQTYNENLQSISDTMGSGHFAENMKAFQNALDDPLPFSVINSHLSETGQSWGDFTSSIGDENTALLEGMAHTGKSAEQLLGGMSSNVQATGEAFTKQFNGMAEAVGKANEGINAFGGAGNMLAGPLEELKSIEPIGFGEAFGNASEGIMGALNNIAMPLMAVQMIGMAVSAVGQSIYDAAAIAEGPAAHSIGSFTGTVDALGQSAAKTGQQFSEGFGQGVLPMLNELNYETTQGQQSMGPFGQSLGLAASTLASLWQIGSGADVIGGIEGLVNVGAQVIGVQQPFQGPGPASYQVQQQQIQQQLAQSTAMMQAQANDPQFLAAQAYLSSQQGKAQQAQTAYNISHYGGTTGPTDPMNAIIQGELINAGGGVYGQSAYTGGCFPAGTRVLLANGDEKPIETLQVSEQVRGHDGTKHVATTILAQIKPPPKPVYTLKFSDGNTLTLTSSHPIATTQGWKALSVEHAKRENPDLAVSKLRIGDCVQTQAGTCIVVDVWGRGIEQTYNITVDAPHTFYANNVLVHNKVLGGSQIMQQVADTTIPQTNLQGSNLIQSLASNFSAADMSHTFTATVTWAATGLEQSFMAAATWAATGLTQSFMAAATWAAQGLSQMFTGVASWVGQGLENLFTGSASWIGQGLTQLFTGVAQWTSQNLIQPFTAAATWVGENLQHLFTGDTKWVGENLEHTFTATANWIGQNLSQTFTAVATFIQGFASGVENFQGGLAVVGEQGPELVYLPQGSSVYPNSTSFSSPIFGDGSGGGGQPVTVIAQFHMDSRLVAQQVIPLMAPMIRGLTGRKA